MTYSLVPTGGICARTLRSDFFTCSTAAVSFTLTPLSAKAPSACGSSLSSAAWVFFKSLPAAANSFAATSPLMLAQTMPLWLAPVSKVSRASSPGFGDVGPVTTSSAFAPRLRAMRAL